MEHTQESLKEVFGFSKIDASLRSYAGMYIDGHIYSAGEHVACMREYQTKFGEMKKMKQRRFTFWSKKTAWFALWILLFFPAFAGPQ